MQAYINSISLISPQLTYDGSFLGHPLVNEKTCVMNCVEPVYKEFISPIALRRMSHIVKLGLAASAICMRQLPDVRPDAVIVGTGWACLTNLEKFAYSVEELQEEALPPTPFINSSNNTISAQIAIQNKLTGYNITYCGHFLSFENALSDALLSISEGKKNVLVGGIDERTDDNFTICAMADYWRHEPVCNLDLFEGSHVGTLNGEGAGFFILGHEKCEQTMARLTGVHTLLLPNATADEVECELDDFLQKHHLQKADIDLFVLGRNGDCTFDFHYDQLEAHLPDDSYIAYYKHLCGDSATSTSFALWVAAQVAASQTLPDSLLFRKGSRSDFRRILIYNQAFGKEFSFILVEKNQ